MSNLGVWPISFTFCSLRYAWNLSLNSFFTIIFIRVSINQGPCTMSFICMMFLLELHLLSCVIPWPELEFWMVHVYEFTFSMQLQFYFWTVTLDYIEMTSNYLWVQNVQTSSLSSILYSINFSWIPVKEFVLKLYFVSWVNLIIQKGTH